MELLQLFSCLPAEVGLLVDLGLELAFIFRSCVLQLLLGLVLGKLLLFVFGSGLVVQIEVPAAGAVVSLYQLLINLFVDSRLEGLVLQLLVKSLLSELFNLFFLSFLFFRVEQH